LIEEYELPPLGDNGVLVRIHAASLNYRELAIARARTPQGQPIHRGVRGILMIWAGKIRPPSSQPDYPLQ
jgi:NADPH:quinone reductase-like Zn-dependent oxidoreductase